MRDYNSKVKTSVWKLTIVPRTTHGRLLPKHREEYKKFQNFVHWLLDKKYGLKKLLHDATNPTNPMKNIRSLSVKYLKEIGPTQGVHYHALIKMSHTGFYRLRYKYVNEIAKNYLGYLLYFHSTASGDSDANWLAYMKKHQHKKGKKV